MAYDWKNASAYLSDLLTGVGTGLLNRPAGAPPLAGFGAGIGNANQLMAMRKQQAMQDQEHTWRVEQMERQKEADQEKKRKEQATAAAFSRLLPPVVQQSPDRPMGAGPGPGQASAAPQASPMLSGMTPEQIAFLQSYGSADPAGALGMIGEQAFAQPKAPTVQDGLQYNPSTGTWDPIPGWLEQKKAIAEAGRAPVQPPAPPADFVLWQADRAADPNNPNFKTIADWRKYQQASAGKMPRVDLTPEQVKARGLPVGTVAQLDPNDNTLHVINKGAEGPGGMFDTKSIPGQALNFLAAHQDDPTSLEYAIAYAVASKPTVSYLPDGTVNSYTPDVSMFKPSAFAGPQAQVDAAAASITGGGAVPPAAATPQPSPNVQSQQVPGGGTVSRVEGGYQTPKDVEKLKDVKAQVGGIKASLQTLRETINAADMTDFLDAASTGGLTAGGRKLSTAWTAAAMQSKVEALLNLGVLNGPDLDLIQKMLPNPATLTGAATSKKAYEAAIAGVEKLIDDKVMAYEQQYGKKTPNAPAASPNVYDKYGLTPPPGPLQ